MGDVLEQITERGQVIFTFLRIHTVINSNKVNLILREDHFRIHADLQVVTAKPGHIFDNYPSYQTGPHISYHFLKIRAVKGCSGIAIINIEVVIGKAVFLAILFQHFFLVLDTIAVTVICVVYG